MSANCDRFAGEAADPPEWGCCDYCGDAIGLGGTLYVHEELNICDGCARRYAWALFEGQAARVCAAPDTPLVMRSNELRSNELRSDREQK